MRIIHILDKNYFDTGSVHQMFQAAQGLRERGHEVTIVSRQGEEMARRTAEAGIEFLALPLRNEADLRSIRALRKTIRERRPDVITFIKESPTRWRWQRCGQDVCRRSSSIAAFRSRSRCGTA